HNIGNALLSDKKIEQSIEAYKKSLKITPQDNDTRYNLAYAQALLKKQQQNKDKNKDNKDKNKDKKKDKQDQKKDQKKDQNKDQKKDQKQDQKQQQQQPRMTKENAQQMLDALMQDEKNTQDKVKKQQVRGTKNAEKDW
ncbi:MAG: tetratricopeptide repeat protein, partial [Paludibacter sp.]